MKKIYVTYTKVSLVYGDKVRWAVECNTEEQVQAIIMDLLSRTNIKNPHINRSGKNLPERTNILLFNEYMNAK